MVQIVFSFDRATRRLQHENHFLHSLPRVERSGPLHQFGELESSHFVLLTSKFLHPVVRCRSKTAQNIPKGLCLIPLRQFQKNNHPSRMASLLMEEPFSWNSRTR